MEEEIKLEVPEWVLILKEEVKKEFGGREHEKQRTIDSFERTV